MDGLSVHCHACADYSCAVEAKILLHGRLYVTDKFVCFYSNFFGFEKKVQAPPSPSRWGGTGWPEPQGDRSSVC